MVRRWTSIALHELAAGAGRAAWQRTTLYQPAPPRTRLPSQRRSHRARRHRRRRARRTTADERRTRSADACGDRRHRAPRRRARATLGTGGLPRDPGIARCRPKPPMPRRASRPSAMPPCAGAATATCGSGGRHRRRDRAVCDAAGRRSRTFAMRAGQARRRLPPCRSCPPRSCACNCPPRARAAVHGAADAG